MQILHSFNSTILRLSKALHWVGYAVLIPLIIVIVTADVFLRYVYSAPLHWGTEVTGLVLLLMFLFVVPYVTATDRHIKIDVVFGRLGIAGQRIVRSITALSGMLVSALLAWRSFHDIADQIRFEEVMPISGLPLWPLGIFITGFGALLFLQFTLQLIEAGPSPGDE